MSCHRIGYDRYSQPTHASKPRYIEKRETKDKRNNRENRGGEMPWLGRHQGVCGECGWVRLLAVCFLYKTNPNPQKISYCGKNVAQMPLLNLIFLGLGWPWVGEFVGFIKYLHAFQPNIIWYIAKHPITKKNNNTVLWDILGRAARIYPLGFRFFI